MNLSPVGLDLVSRRLVLAMGVGFAASRSALAQEAGRIYRLGFVVQSARATYAPLLDELRRQGFIEGRNLLVDPRGFGLSIDRLETGAVDVAAAEPDAIFVGGTAAARAAQRATTTIPIVAIADDMMRDQIVPSLARPGGNVTGISILTTELDAKRLELLTQMVPGIRHVAALVDPGTASPEHLQMLVALADSRGLVVAAHQAGAQPDIPVAIEAARATGAQAIIILASALFHANRAAIIEHTARAQLPAIYQFPEYGASGALVAYGPRINSLYRQSAWLIVKVMVGVKPADIPIQQPTKFELVINLKTADALGLSLPSPLLVAADEVIE